MNIGGSEKLGWSVHYYSYIMPFIFYFSSKGFIIFFEKTKNSKLKYYNYLILVFFSLHSFTIDPYDHKNLIHYKNIKKNKISQNYIRVFDKDQLSDLKNKIHKRKTFFSVIPDNVSISMRENHSTYFSAKNYNKISFFPIWIGESDYVIIDMAIENNKFEIYFDALLPKENQLFEARKCVERHLSNKYIQIDSLDTSNQTKTVIYKKIN